MKKARQATLVEALIPIIFLIIILGLSLTLFKVDPQIPLLLGTVVAALIGVYRLGFKWEELENGIIQTITMAVQAILILLIVGTLIGTWILSGVVPSMIYWGLNILSPSIFLVATLLICSIVAVSTGSSWTTAGTVGIALLGIGQTLGISAPIIAGAHGLLLIVFEKQANTANWVMASHTFSFISWPCFRCCSFLASSFVFPF